MTNNDRRAVAIVLFGAALIGALVPSYLHVAAFMRPVMPPELALAQYVAALALDVLIIAASYAIIVTPPTSPRAWAHVGLWAAVGASIYANARYAMDHALYGPDAIISAALPVLAVIATHGLAGVLRAIPADVAEAPAPTPPVAASEPRKAAPAPKASPTPKRATRKATGAQDASWHSEALALKADGLSGAEIARRVGVHQSNVSRYLNGAAVNGNGQAVG